MTGYRRDIDGLRALAVLCVVFYHIGFGWMLGGFVGVDVFFVISGYLITGLISREVLATGRFDYVNFYIRRARRLFPALFMTTLATFVAGVFLFPPKLLTALAGSLLAAIFSGSNILFWQTSGYFDASNNLKPLLHTWSLSVEEQFYLVWPLLIVVCLTMARRRLFWLLAGIAAASFAGSFFFLRSPEAVFYLLPFRIWELAGGAGLLWAERRVRFSGLSADAAYIAGGALILASAVFLTDKSLFPNHNALIPCAGAALMIVAGRDARAARLLTNRSAVGIGVLSYSLYLIHWPLIVFYQYWLNRPVTIGDQLGIIGATLVLALALYVLIEKPFRRPGPIAWVRERSGFAAAVGISVVVVSSLAVSAKSANGWPSRYPREVQVLLQNAWEPIGLAYPLFTCFKLQTTPISDVPQRCYVPDKHDKRPKILLAGDSSINHLVSAFQAVLGDKYAVYLWSTASCAPLYGDFYPGGCQDSNNFLFEHILKENDFDLVMLSSTSAWTDTVKYFRNDVGVLTDRGTDYVLLGQIIAYRDWPINLIARFGRGDIPAMMRSNLSISCEGEHGLDAIVPPRNFFSVKKAMCNGDMPIYEAGGRLLQADTLHLTETGAVFVAERLVKWLDDNGHLQVRRADRRAD